MGGYRPGRPAYDQTQMMAQRTRAIEHINQLTRAQSRGHRQEQCGTTSFWEELGNSWREGWLLPDLGRVGLHELKTNPFWRQRITPKDIWQFARDLDRRVNDWFDKGIDQIVQEAEDFVDYAREHPLEASIFLSGGWVAVVANRAWQEIEAHPVEAAMLIGGVVVVAVAAIAAVASGGALLPVIVGMATGAVSGVAGQAIEDAATGQFSGWGAYVKQAAIGAVIGGVTGVIGAGASALGLPSIVTGLVSGATAGTFSQALTNVWEGRSWHEGLGQAGLTAALGGMLGGAVLGQLSPQAGLWTRMAVGGGVSAATGGATHAAMNKLAGRDWREGLGRAIAVGFTTGAVDAVTDYYGDRWQAQQEANHRGRTMDAGGEDTPVRARQAVADPEIQAAVRKAWDRTGADLNDPTIRDAIRRGYGPIGGGYPDDIDALRVGQGLDEDATRARAIRRSELPQRDNYEQWIKGQLTNEEWKFFRQMAGSEHLNRRIVLSGSLAETELGLQRRYDPDLQEFLPEWRRGKSRSGLIDVNKGDIDLWRGPRGGRKLAQREIDYIGERLPKSLKGFEFDPPTQGYNARRYPRLETFLKQGGGLVFEPDGTVWRLPSQWQRPDWPQRLTGWPLDLELYKAISTDPQLFERWWIDPTSFESLWR